MTLSKWIEDYCEENGIELPSDIPDEETALQFIETINGTILSAPTSEDIGKIVKVEYSDKQDKPFLPNTTFTWDEEYGNWLPYNITDIVDESLFYKGNKLALNINGNTYYSTVIENGGVLSIGFLIDDEFIYEFDVYIEDGEYYCSVDKDPETSPFNAELYSLKLGVVYDDEYDLYCEIDKGNSEGIWKSKYSLSKLKEIVGENNIPLKTKIIIQTWYGSGASQTGGLTIITDNIWFFISNGDDLILNFYLIHDSSSVGIWQVYLDSDGHLHYWD